MFGFGGRCDRCGARARGLCTPCRNALERPTLIDLRPELDHVLAVFAYAGAGASLLRSLKFRNRHGSIGVLVDAALEAIGPHRGYDLVVPVPPDRVRLRQRGYDLPTLLARRLAAGLVTPVATPLLRTDGGSQRDRGRAERSRGVGYACPRPAPGRILLVDDVVTTGSTARSCAAALRGSGAVSVELFALAATPPPDSDCALHRSGPEPVVSISTTEDEPEVANAGEHQLSSDRGEQSAAGSHPFEDRATRAVRSGSRAC